MATGSPSRLHAAVGLYAYLHGQQPVSGGLDLFAAAVASEAMGAVITYGRVYSFCSVSWAALV